MVFVLSVPWDLLQAVQVTACPTTRPRRALQGGHAFPGGEGSSVRGVAAGARCSQRRQRGLGVLPWVHPRARAGALLVPGDPGVGALVEELSWFQRRPSVQPTELCWEA